jgi:phosphatidate phosphatase APP1
MRDALHLRGRLIERKGVQGTGEESSMWQNVLNTIRRIDSDEIPGALLRAHLHGRTWETRTDDEGFFVFDLDPERERVNAPVLIPSPDAEFAVVSDLDDTVIRTKSTELLQQVAIIFGKGAQTRTPFPGVAALYRALELGPDERGRNPIFYVSRSGWNLYDLFTEFMDANDIPIGPLFLSDLRVMEDRSPVIGHEAHKFESIDELIRAYPELPFVLIGDSGMEDPELYRELASAHRGRIRAVYIHDVSPDERDERVDEIGRGLEEDGIAFARFADARETARHAAEVGLISVRGLENVEADSD